MKMFFRSVLGVILVFCNCRIDGIYTPFPDFDTRPYAFPYITGLGPVTYPPQGLCSVSNIDTTDIMPGDWILVKATPLSFPPPSGYDENINFCSAFCYVPKICGGVRMLIQLNDDQTMTFNTYSSNLRLKDIAHFETTVIQVDPTSKIYQGRIATMEILADVPGGEFDDITQIPQIIAETQGVPFVKICSGNAGKWMILSTCDQNQYTFVLLSHEAVHNEEFYYKYRNEYEQALAFVSGVKTFSLVDIPLSHYDRV